MSICLQKSASIQPRTSPSKFGGKFNSIFIRFLGGDPDEEQRLAAELDAALLPDGVSGDPEGGYASAALLQAVAVGSADAPAAFALCGGVSRLACVHHAQGGASVFVDGERVAHLAPSGLPGEPTLLRAVARLCGGGRVATRDIAAALRESGEFRDLVARLVEQRVLRWVP